MPSLNRINHDGADFSLKHLNSHPVGHIIPVDYDSFLDEYTLRSLVNRYSNYVRYPIRMEVTKQRQLPEPDPKPDDYVPEWEDYTEVETLNSMVPIWKRRKSEVKQEEYNEFYKGQFHDFTDPIRTMSVHAEGALSYDVLAFIPGQAPWDLYSKDYEKGLQLYSSNVLIMEKCPELLPDYYNFVRGIVDSQDLSLNISRETLQHDSQLRAIANKVEKKITSELSSMRDNDRETYESFFDNFGRGIKYGIYSSYGANAHELAPLLLFLSAKHNKMVTLDEYLADAPDDQKAIYYAAGENAERLGKMPMVTSVLARGYDVLLCTQDVDEFCRRLHIQVVHGQCGRHACRTGFYCPLQLMEVLQCLHPLGIDGASCLECFRISPCRLKVSIVFSMMTYWSSFDWDTCAVAVSAVTAVIMTAVIILYPVRDFIDML